MGGAYIVIVKMCEECGVEFNAVTNRQRFCKGPHTQVCKVCGTTFTYTCSPTEKPNTCSKSCKYKYMRQAVKAKYGVEYISQIPAVRSKKRISNASKSAQERSKQTCLDKYGVEYAAQSDSVRAQISQKLKSPEIQEKRRLSFQRNWGVDHVFQSAEFREKYGCNVVSTLPETKQHMKETLQTRYGVDNLAHIPGVVEKAKQTRLDTVRSKYGVDNVFQSEEFRQHMSDTWGAPNAGQCPELRSKARYNSKIQCKDKTFDSHYELDVYKFAESVGAEVITQIPIEYDYRGETHITYIDFMIDGILFEVKGSHLMRGLYEYDPSIVPIDVKLDVYRQHHVIVITDSDCRDMFGKPDSSESNGLKYLNKCPNPLIGVDISLFRNPIFPYADDRPSCFYDVRVDGQMSAHEAFRDPKIIWKMIKNRIQYTGGFIDAKQVLKALNVTRTCKQPSWFSKTLARNIISNYCTSNTIVDFCAGWGTRHDAARELGRRYVGCDFNKELVDWHHEQGRASIQWGDAHDFHYDSVCSVFICPPYSDPQTGRCFEDYNFDGFDASASAMSQCQWLKLAMQNIPNASEYVMVCKIVDGGWEKYIVDTKLNKSHFGSNNEYILCVPQEDRLYVLGSL